MGTRIITIERQYATGGRKIAKLVAEKLGIPYYNNHILELAGQKIGLPADYLQDVEETTSGSLLFSLAMAATVNATGVTLMSLSQQLFVAEEQIINELVKEGPCIIVGRCASHILRDRDDCLNVFVYGDKETRVRRAIDVYNIPKNEAESMVRKMDKRRANFYNTNVQKKWNEHDNYHLCLDSGTLGIEKCVDLIVEAAKF
ncbi:MAG: cytidylate kinase-like family protein [Clostridia bacterium]|nr:cytidylate kinase-like family protein [Clostridia bacterium]